MITERKKRPKPEDFIGWKSPDGKLEVIGVAGKQGYKTLYKVTCTECSKDKELFPDGYFVSLKDNLIRGKLPCGCSKNPYWEPDQQLLRVRRSANKNGDFIVHGFAEEFHGSQTKVSCECLIDGYRWCARSAHIIHKGVGCPKCRNELVRVIQTTPEHIAIDKCIIICKEMGYTPIGFVNGYVGANKTRFEYICHTHGKQNVSYDSFVSTGSRCPSCAEYGYNPDKKGSFYIVVWTKDNHSFIKFGITNREVNIRVDEQSKGTDYQYDIIFSKTWNDGHVALNLEKSIKQNNMFETKVINKVLFNSGFTETLNIGNLKDLLYYVNTYVNKISSL